MFKIVFAIATIKSHIIWKIDIKLAFSQGNIGENTIYLTQLEGFNTKNLYKVLLLGKALYRLKQSVNI